MSEMTVEQQDAFAILLDKFEEFGLGTLGPKIIEYIKAGYSGDSIALLLRDTAEYKARFPAMEALRQSGRSIDEVDYINYERNAANLEQQYGIPKGYLTSSDTIAKLMVENVTGEDLTSRVQLNAAAQRDAPPELRQTLEDYYGLDANASLTAYYLDPEYSLDYLNRQMATARIGAQARRQSLSLGLDSAALLAQRGVSDQQAEQGFAQVASLQGLTAGDGMTVDQATLVEGVFGNNAAREQVERVQRTRNAKFQGGGGAADGQQGISGLGRG